MQAFPCVIYSHIDGRNFDGGDTGDMSHALFQKAILVPCRFTVQKPCYATFNKDTSSTRPKRKTAAQAVSLSLDPPTSSLISSAVSCVIGRPRCHSILLAHRSASCPGVLINLPLLIGCLFCLSHQLEGLLY